MNTLAQEFSSGGPPWGLVVILCGFMLLCFGWMWLNRLK